MTGEPAALLACPFCGGSQVSVTYDGPTSEQIKHAISWGQDYDAHWFVECGSCDVSTRPYDEEAEAVAAWNRRAPDAAVLDPMNEAQQKCIALEIIRIEHPMLDPEKCWPDVKPAVIRALTALRGAARGSGT